MINKLETKNYHSHKNTTIDFCNGVNIITGSSDAGKSSILRAIKWVATNRPMGDSVQSWWIDKNDETNVCISMPEGQCTKKRIEGKVIYELGINSGKTCLEAVKTDVPDEVKDLFNFSEFNYQSQHSPYLLLNESPGEVAKKLNDLVGLSIIDTMFKNLASKALDNKRKAEEESKKAVELTNQIEKLSYLDDIDSTLAIIKQSINEYDNRLIKNSHLISLISDYKKMDENIHSFARILDIEDDFKKLNKEIDNYSNLNIKYLNLCSMVVKLNNCQKEIDQYSRLLPAKNNADKLFELVKIYQTRQIKYIRLQNIVKSLNETKDYIRSENEWLQIETECLNISNMITEYVRRSSNSLKLKKIIINYKLASDTTKETNLLNELVVKKRKILVDNKICPFCKTQLTDAIIEGIL